MSRQRILLLLFVALGLALTYAWFETPRQQRVSQGHETAAENSRLANDDRQQARSSAIGLDFSGGEKRSYKKPIRDLFRVLYTKPKPVKQVVVAPPRPKPVEKPIRMPVLPLKRPAALPKAGFKPIPPLKVLGYLQKGETQSVFLSSVQGDIFVVKRGDRFADGLLVRALNTQEIVISRSLKDPGVTLPIREKEYGKSAVKSYTPQRSTMPRMNIPQMKNINPQSPVPISRPSLINGETTVDP